MDTHAASEPVDGRHLRVAMLCPYSLSAYGGVQAHTLGLARALRALGHRIDVLAPLDFADRPRAESVITLGATIPIRDNGSVARVTLDPRALSRTLTALRRGGYDLLHIQEPMVPIPGPVGILFAPFPVVGTFHKYAPGAAWYRTFGRLTRPTLARLDAAIAVSPAAQAHAAHGCPGPMTIIPNGVDLPPPRPRTRAPGPARIVFIGRAEPRKGLQVLLAALPHVRAPVQVDLVGARPNQVRRLVETLPAGVRAHGVVSDVERRLLLSRADIVCAPSIASESFGIVLVEGMAQGAPVVASDIDGYRDVLPPDCGRLVPPNDAAALALALEELALDEALRRRLGEAGAREARRYAWPRVARQVLYVYERALGRRHPRT